MSDDADRDTMVGLLLEQFLNKGMGTIRDLAVQAYLRGQHEAFGRGRAEGEEQRIKLEAEVRAHMFRWQEDRRELMPIVPGYEYKNRVDDPEWAEAKAKILAILQKAKAAA